jgi:D-aminopeptidase
MTKPRARDLGLDLPGTSVMALNGPGVPGIAVGARTIVDEHLRPGRKLPVRTGVTAIIPHFGSTAPRPVYAGFHRLNGNGEMTGSHWIEDGGCFTGPVLITNTHSVGVAHHAAVRWMIETFPAAYEGRDHLWIMPVVAETYDGLLNDINGQHVTEADVFAALNCAGVGPVAEGNTGGGTGMICYEFKGGTGTASRVVGIAGKTHTVGVLVQANHGIRDWLTICGVPVGRQLRDGMVAGQLAERGSIIVVVATDIPMAPHQLKRVARRCSLGLARNGTPGGNSSGDIFLAFSTGNDVALPHQAPPRFAIDVVNDELFDPIYLAVVESVEEAVINALLAAEDSGGTEHDRYHIRALPVDSMVALLRTAGRVSGHGVRHL